MNLFNLHLSLNIVMTSFHSTLLLLCKVSLGSFFKETGRQGHIRFQKLNLDEPKFQKAGYLMQFPDSLFDCEPKTLCFVDTKQKVEQESVAKSLSSPS